MKSATLVVGIGNPLRGDDAVGRLAAEHFILLQTRLLSENLRAEVALSEGETSSLLELLQGRHRAVLFDATAVQGRAAPNRLVEIAWLRPHCAPTGSSAAPEPTASSHSLGLGTALALAHSLGFLPPRVDIIGIPIHVERLNIGAGGTISDAARQDAICAANRVIEILIGPTPSAPERAMHEHSLVVALIRQIEEIATREGGRRVVGLRVRLGALSHFTPDHFLEHFERAAQGTLAEGAAVVAELVPDESDPNAQVVVIESVDIEE